MASNSTLDPDNYSLGDRRQRQPSGHGIGSLGPGDSSDSGSDLAGVRPNSEDLSLDRGADEDSDAGHTNDIDIDRVVSASGAGLGGGLDQAEEALYGVKDEDRSPAAVERRRRIAEAAYYRAEQRGFAPGNEDDDWLTAEKDIDAER